MELESTVSELKVMKSTAGYYIGRDCIEGPYSRESHYFPTVGLAESALKNNTFWEYRGQ